MTADGFNDNWDEFCLIGITAASGTEVQFAALTNDISGMDFGEKDIEGQVMANGGRVVKKTGMTDESVTLKMIPVSADMDGTGIIQFFHPQTEVSSANSVLGTIDDQTVQPLVVYNSNRRRKHKIVFLWATLLPALASTAPAADKAAYRIEVINAYCTKATPSYDDKQLTVEATFKWAPFQKTNIPNKRESSTDGSAQLAVATTLVTGWS